MKLGKLTLRLALVLFLLIATGFSVGYGIPASLADAQSLKARRLIERWRDGKAVMPTAAEWSRVRNEMVRALKTAPDNAQLLDDLGFVYAFRAQSLPDAPDLADLRQSLLTEAEAYFHLAAVLRPMFPYGWGHLALARHYRGDAEAEIWFAFDKAMAYGRNEPHVQRMLAEIAFARWSSLGPEREQAVLSMVADMPERLREPLLELAERHAVTLDLPPPP